MSNLKDELVGAYNKVVNRRDEFLHDHFTNLLKSLERKKKKTPGLGFAKMKCREKFAEIERRMKNDLG